MIYFKLCMHLNFAGWLHGVSTSVIDFSFYFFTDQIHFIFDGGTVTVYSLLYFPDLGKF